MGLFTPGDSFRRKICREAPGGFGVRREQLQGLDSGVAVLAPREHARGRRARVSGRPGHRGRSADRVRAIEQLERLLDKGPAAAPDHDDLEVRELLRAFVPMPRASQEALGDDARRHANSVAQLQRRLVEETRFTQDLHQARVTGIPQGLLPHAPRGNRAQERAEPVGQETFESADAGNVEPLELGQRGSRHEAPVLEHPGRARVLLDHVGRGENDGVLERPPALDREASDVDAHRLHRVEVANRRFRRRSSRGREKRRSPRSPSSRVRGRALRAAAGPPARTRCRRSASRPRRRRGASRNRGRREGRRRRRPRPRQRRRSRRASRGRPGGGPDPNPGRGAEGRIRSRRIR